MRLRENHGSYTMNGLLEVSKQARISDIDLGRQTILHCRIIGYPRLEHEKATFLKAIAGNTELKRNEHRVLISTR